MLLFFRLIDRIWIGMLFQVCMELVFVNGPHCIGAMSRNPPSSPSKRILLPTLQVARGNTCYDYTNSKNYPNIIQSNFLLFAFPGSEEERWQIQIVAKGRVTCPKCKSVSRKTVEGLKKHMENCRQVSRELPNTTENQRLSR